MSADLRSIRAAIDEVDARLVPLLEARAALVERAAEAKEAAGLPARDDVRAAQILLAFPAGAARAMMGGLLAGSARWMRERMRPPPQLVAEWERELDRAPAGALPGGPVAAAIGVALILLSAVIVGLLHLAGR